VATSVRFGLLGPVSCHRDGVPDRLTAAMQRAILAILLLDANKPVPTERLVAALWGDRPPATATASLHNHVNRLRQRLGEDGPERIRLVAPGYQISVRAGELDLHDFTVLYRRGREAHQARQWDSAARELSAMLKLWRGEPLADVAYPVLTEADRARLSDMRLQALDWRIDADLHLGRHAEVTAELRTLSGAHPLVEAFPAHLMLALYRCGRQADALGVYEQTRALLSEELGIEPGPGLSGLHQRILLQDPELLRTPDADTSAAPATDPQPQGSAPDEAPRPEPKAPVPRTLPAGTSDFTGREPQLTRLLAELSVPAGDSAHTVVISSIGGMGGVGKTTLAVHAAYSVRDRFPDGQLYANLRGTAPEPQSPGALLGQFLRQFGVAAESIPIGEEERSALYRSLLAERRVLVLLDDARDAAQVRPLIPGSPGCAVLVTVRNRMTGLEGATHLDLEGLAEESAHELLGRIVGVDRLTAEPEATRAVLTACAGLPLAIRLVGCRLAARPQWRVQDLADRLHTARRRLDEISFGDQNVRASFEVSYSGLTSLDGPQPPPAAAARAFCLLGLWTGPDISLPAAASLLGEPLHVAEQALEHLVDVHLLQSPQPDRYSLHDLLRVFAAEQAARDIDTADATAALTRLVTWYTQAADAVDALLAPHRRRTVLEPVPGLAPALDLRSPAEAVEWAEGELANLTEAVGLAHERGLRQLTWLLPAALWSFFLQQRHTEHWIATHETGLAGALAARDRAAEATVRNNLSIALLTVGRFAEAIPHLETCVAIRTALGGDADVSAPLNNLGIASMEAGLPEKAVDVFQQVVEYSRKSGGVRRRAGAHANLGQLQFLLGRNAESLVECLEAERLYRQQSLPDPDAQLSIVLNTMSEALQRLGEPDRARPPAEESVAIRTALCDRRGTAESLRQLGGVLRDLGDRDGARRAWTETADILRDLDDPGLGEVRELLAALD